MTVDGRFNNSNSNNSYRFIEFVAIITQDRTACSRAYSLARVGEPEHLNE